MRVVRIARIERTLNKLDGVTAAVNYATERAQVEFAPSVSTADLIRVIGDAGYTATPPKTAAAQDDSAPSRPARTVTTSTPARCGNGCRCRCCSGCR